MMLRPGGVASLSRQSGSWRLVSVVHAFEQASQGTAVASLTVYRQLWCSDPVVQAVEPASQESILNVVERCT